LTFILKKYILLAGMSKAKSYESQLHVYINKAIKEKAEEIAKKEGRTLSEVIREFLANYVKGETNAKSL
jgi:predicted HicB family RNase H-like nuclease